MITDNITIGSYTLSDWGLLPNSVSIASPAPRTYTVDVPGRSGVLDFSEALGGVRYQNRTITMELYCFAPEDQLFSMEEACRNALHGKMLDIVFSEDPDYAYRGRISVEWASGGNIDTATITADCAPYKYKRIATTVEGDVAGTHSFVLENSGNMPVTPTVFLTLPEGTESEEVTLTFGESTLKLNLNETNSGMGRKLAGLYLEEGASRNVAVSGNVHVKFEYQEGML